MPHHRIGGTIWHRRMNRLGYMVIAPPVDMVDHMAFRNGVNWKAQIKVERKLLKGELINFHYAGYQKRLYNGHQRVSGLPLVEGSVSPWLERIGSGQASDSGTAFPRPEILPN